MAFTYTRNLIDAGGKRYANGTYTNTAGSTGGSIQTGLSRIETFFMTANSATGDGQHTYNDTLPKAGGSITVATEADQLGSWLAIGE